jgi:hypothetical protein
MDKAIVGNIPAIIVSAAVLALSVLPFGYFYKSNNCGAWHPAFQEEHCYPSLWL